MKVQELINILELLDSPEATVAFEDPNHLTDYYKVSSISRQKTTFQHGLGITEYHKRHRDQEEEFVCLSRYFTSQV